MSPRPLAFWLLATLLVAACAEGPAGTSFEEFDSAIETPPLDPDAGMPNVQEPQPGGTGGLDSSLPMFPIPGIDASTPPVMMMDASRPPQTMDAGRDASMPPPVVMDAARPPVVADAAPDVVAPRPDTGTPPPSGNTCGTTPAYPTPDACSKCICTKCPSQVATCFASPDTAANAQCKSVRDCAQANHCTGTNCYCGDSLLCLAPNGPCVNQIQTAAGATDPLGVQAAADDPNNPVGRSNAVGTCEMANCAAECGL